MFTINHSNGCTETHETLQGAIDALRADHPECVAYFADGAPVKSTHDKIHPNSGDRVLVWETEADSVDDDGTRAIASITS